MRLSFGKKVMILIVVVVIASAVFWFSRPTEYESIRVTPESRIVSTEEGQVFVLYIQNTGTRTAEIYWIECLYNFTFTSDIIIPQGVNAKVSFPIVGGPVAVETISSEGEVATCGGEAISDYNPEEPYLVGTSYAVYVNTRSDGFYTFEQIVKLYEY